MARVVQDIALGAIIVTVVIVAVVFAATYFKYLVGAVAVLSLLVMVLSGLYLVGKGTATLAGLW
mgnify:CR=1 FL=1